MPTTESYTARHHTQKSYIQPLNRINSCLLSYFVISVRMKCLGFHFSRSWWLWNWLQIKKEESRRRLINEMVLDCNCGQPRVSCVSLCIGCLTMFCLCLGQGFRIHLHAVQTDRQVPYHILGVPVGAQLQCLHHLAHWDGDDMLNTWTHHSVTEETKWTLARVALK